MGAAIPQYNLSIAQSSVSNLTHTPLRSIAIFNVLKHNRLPSHLEVPIHLYCCSHSQRLPTSSDLFPPTAYPGPSTLPSAGSAYIGLVEETDSLFVLSPARFPRVVFGSKERRALPPSVRQGFLARCGRRISILLAQTVHTALPRRRPQALGQRGRYAGRPLETPARCTETARAGVTIADGQRRRRSARGGKAYRMLISDLGL